MTRSSSAASADCRGVRCWAARRWSPACIARGGQPRPLYPDAAPPRPRGAGGAACSGRSRRSTGRTCRASASRSRCCRAATSSSSLNKVGRDQHQQQRRLRRRHVPGATSTPSACAPSFTYEIEVQVRRASARTRRAASRSRRWERARRRQQRDAHRPGASSAEIADCQRLDAVTRRRRVRSGFEARRRAERRQRAAGAVRLAREADAPAVPDQLVADPDPAAPAGSPSSGPSRCPSGRSCGSAPRRIASRCTWVSTTTPSAMP